MSSNPVTHTQVQPPLVFNTREVMVIVMLLLLKQQMDHVRQNNVQMLIKHLHKTVNARLTPIFAIQMDKDALH